MNGPFLAGRVFHGRIRKVDRGTDCKLTAPRGRRNNYGSDGYLVITGYNTYEAFLGRDGKPGPKNSDVDSDGKRVDPVKKHFANFIEAVRSRKKEHLHGPVETAHTSSALAHLGNISDRLGRRLKFDPSSETFVDDSEANAMLTREYRKPFVVPEHV